MTQFQPGHTYYGRSLCDYECLFTAKILSRTEKTVLAIVDYKPEPKRFMVRARDNHEFINLGRYSMAPVISAEKELRP